MPNTIPTFDFASRAKITRKTIERLASFSKMQSSSSESNALFDRTLTKINGLVQLLDSSIITAELAYQFATTAMIACNKESVGATMEDLSTLASKGSDLAQKVATGVKGIEQAVNKIAASTKDNMLVVKIPPDSTQTTTVNKHLKDVGTDLVANLKLFTEFSRAADEIAEWWACVKSELVSDASAIPHLSSSESRPGELEDQSAMWSGMKENLWEYYTIVKVAQDQFPDLLGPSIAAWKSASARDVSNPKIQSREEADRQSSAPPKRGKSIGRLLSRFYLEKRTSNTNAIRASSENQEPEMNGRDLKPLRPSRDVPAKEASGSSDSSPEPDKNRKIQTLFKGCISAGPFCK